jgi:hypothetical protein
VTEIMVASEERLGSMELVGAYPKYDSHKSLSASRNPIKMALARTEGKDRGEEFRLLRYKKPVRTSQETHYVSATDSSLLMLY